MRGIITFLVVCGTLLGTVGSAGAKEPSGDQPRIETIKGDEIVVVITPSGNTIGRVGTEVNPGDRIRTGPHATVSVKYPDGSRLLIGRKTEMAVLDPRKGTHRGELREGAIRGLIQKPKGFKKTRKRPSFVFRGRSAVMGVRGTDFVFADKEGAKANSLHTLEGTVAVGKTEPEVMGGGGVPVGPSQMIESGSTGLGKVHGFDQVAYVASLDTTQPDFGTLSQSEDEIKRKADLEWAKPLKRLRLLEFRVNEVHVSAPNGEVFTGQLSWNPVMEVGGPFAVRGHLSAYPLKSVNNDIFIASEFGLLGEVRATHRLSLEAGIAAQTWHGGHAQTGPMAMANVGWKLTRDGLFERVFVGISGFKQNVLNGTETRTPVQLKAGLGFHF